MAENTKQPPYFCCPKCQNALCVSLEHIDAVFAEVKEKYDTIKRRRDWLKKKHASLPIPKACPKCGRPMVGSVCPFVTAFGEYSHGKS